MSLIRHTFFPRSAFDMDYWLRPDNSLGTTTLDIFDPFDDLDRVLGRNLMWLDVPDMLKTIAQQPRVPKKHRITVNCRGFNANSIKTQVSEDKTKLVVTGKEGSPAKHGDEDYTLRELRRTYKLPKKVETDKMVSFMTSNEHLVIEMPLKRDEKEDESPRLVDDKSGNKSVEMNMWLPKKIDPAKVKVTCKDRDLIVQAEYSQSKEDETSRVYYYRRSTLPENTDLNQLKCTLDNNQLSIKAPVHTSIQQQYRTIPIELIRKEQQESIAQGKDQPQQQEEQQQQPQPQTEQPQSDQTQQQPQPQSEQPQQEQEQKEQPPEQKSTKGEILIQEQQARSQQVEQ